MCLTTLLIFDDLTNGQKLLVHNLCVAGYEYDNCCTIETVRIYFHFYTVQENKIQSQTTNYMHYHTQDIKNISDTLEPITRNLPMPHTSYRTDTIMVQKMKH